MRTDIHRPSAIEPTEYDFVGVEFDKVEDIGSCLMLAEERKTIKRHMQQTGGTYSRHQHGGNCHVCGAACIYTALFHHVETNTYIRTGFDCADKMHVGDAVKFRAFKAAIHDARERQAGKAKAEAILADADLSRAWKLYKLNEGNPEPTELVEIGAVIDNGEGCEYGRYANTREFETLLDIVGKLIRYGSISDGQERYLHTLVDRIERRREIEAERDAERAAAEDCPEGRVKVTGAVLKTELRENGYGETWKMTVKDDRGFLVWGSVPSTDDLVERGVRIEFMATVTPSDRDTKFGFFKRPTKANVI